MDSTAAAEEKDLGDLLIEGVEREGDRAVREHFAAGRAVYYWEEDTPKDHAIRKYPDGRRELVRREAGKVVVVRSL
ncbi:hypothetical protein STAQ_33300 [Allostella sp. ATCC 35155]|nr:hypothetical protein STAQ_33300 [Stella sp. ATCC 35155]